MSRRPPFPWTRLIVCAIAVAMVELQWRWAVYHLYSLPKEAYGPFQAITVNAMYVVGAIAIFLISGKLIYDWKNSTASEVITEAKTAFSRQEFVIDPKFQTPELIERYADK